MKYPLLALIKLYQWTISPLLGPVCKYYPSCSHYGYGAIDRHGAIKGTALTAWRILRCNPWSLGGVDHVPPRKRPRWHEMLRNARRDRGTSKGGNADAPSGGSGDTSSSTTGPQPAPSPAAETSPHAQGA
ncbi:membrane protein insertion efficiency factor YidD [Streptomyces albidoflavus]|uniref:membrane protein insertion efficiency factor YidD n=1 Tax=Streptomyces albidoflavus TaxID=1886 RepID=UPI00101E3593|nr:membrane protein insertion efficiency factor YidD [Streptomyces albidoflavus]RZE92410.1 membrane protein insertion efficiency factor YidD [Streptomyces albidoflavus]RZE95038.1 membrane protein insertion efficiency factor YidD [Streptomyces albidoflavus]